ncbi:MAG: polyprenyl synthetase family protein [Crocinitomicaceae bacterium]|nr:polyprenyl synthetase family protein [Crocinitomicaceae bacterium]
MNLSTYASYFDVAIKSYAFPTSPVNLYEPLDYFLQLGGKRIRPLLTLISAELFGSTKENAIHASLSVELFHNFSLIHDDIMDKAPLRRSQPTVHTKWDDNIAILSGDVLLVKAYQELAKQDSIHIAALLEVFNKTAVEVCEGQQMDMDFEVKEDVLLSDYIEMIRLKTSVLLGGALEMGAIVANASLENRKLIYDFGQNIGIAFQLQDDILDLFGDPEKFGKQIGGDIISNKKTYLLLRAFELANQDQRKELSSMLLMTDYNTKIAKAQQLFVALGVLDDAKRMKAIYQEKASLSLGNIPVEEGCKIVLFDLAEQLLNREI